MIEIGKNAKIKVHWNVLSYDYKPDKIDEIRTLMANKYGKSKDDINVVPDVILPSIDDAGGLFSKKTVEDVQNPESHKLLFKKYLDLYNIKDYDFDAIEAIDNEVNSEIEYNPYNKYRKLMGSQQTKVEKQHLRWTFCISCCLVNLVSTQNKRSCSTICCQKKHNCGLRVALQ